MISKSALCAFVFFSLITIVQAQQNASADIGENPLLTIVDMRNIGGRQLTSPHIRNPARKVFGSYYLFEDWENTGVIQTKSAKAYKIKGLNFNIKDNRIESRVGMDSIFAFDLTGVDFFLIDDRKFKEIYVSRLGQNRIAEVIIENQEFMIFKDYRSTIKRNNPDPLMRKPIGDEFVSSSDYYIKKGNQVERFKPTKQRILELFPEHIEEIKNYVRENNLTYRKSEDLKKIYLKWKTL